MIYNKFQLNSILIGAPRARFNYSSGQIESGAIYECDLNKDSLGICERFNDEANVEKLNGSWLGMSIASSMDSVTSDNEAFVVNTIVDNEFSFYLEKLNPNSTNDCIISTGLCTTFYNAM